MFFNSLRVTTVVIAIGTAVAQRPADTSICDYYTTALLHDNNATNQYTLLTLLVNTAVIGNYTQPNHNAVPGILNPNATFNGTGVNLVPYFSGAFVSTNNNGTAVSVNFLDDGGATPLTMNKPANGTSSSQYKLLTHLYSYFGFALGCTTYGTGSFPAYTGSGSQYEVHRFMALDANEVGYFIQQVGLSARSFGVTDADVAAVGQLLTTTFDVKCAAPATVITAQGNQLQSICTADDCTTAQNASCSSYASFPGQPANASSTGSSPSPSSKSSAFPNMGISMFVLSITCAAIFAAVL